MKREQLQLARKKSITCLQKVFSFSVKILKLLDFILVQRYNIISIVCATEL